MYFIQGIGDPTSGLIAQPIRSLLKGWGDSPTAIAGFMGLLSLPWTLKPIFGLLSDFVPLFGSRRRNYLLISCISAAVGLFVLYLFPVPPGQRWLLFGWLLLPTMGIAFGDVLVDALMIETGQPLGLTGRLQSAQWTATNVALLLTGVVGGYVTTVGRADDALLFCALLWGVSLLLAYSFARDAPNAAPPDPRETGEALLGALRRPGFATVSVILFVWSFNPLWTSVLYLHMTQTLHFDEQTYGNTQSVFSAGCVVGGLLYGAYCRRVRLGVLMYVSIVAGAISNALYWHLTTVEGAYVVSFLAGAAYLTGLLIQLDVAARLVTVEVAATLFALLMALTNLSASLSEALGGYLYDELHQDQRAFEWIVLISTFVVVACWAWMPRLKREVPLWWEAR